MGKRRIFSAFHVPDSIVSEALLVQKELQSTFETNDWYFQPVANIHMTCCFAGEIDETQIELFINAHKKVLSKEQHVSFATKGIALLEHAVVISVTDVSDDATNIQKEVSAELSKSAIAMSEKAWHPHITLARSKKKIDEHVLQNISVPEVTWHSEEVQIFESFITHKGATYKQLATITL